MLISPASDAKAIDSSGIDRIIPGVSIV